MGTLALIPARGGSKGIPRKNIALLHGKPLIAWTIAAARQSGNVSRIVVSTEDAEIARIAEAHGAEVPFIRPAALAEDTTPGMDVVFHALDLLPGFDDLLLLQPTSPLRTAADIDAIFALRAACRAPAAVSVVENGHPPQWMFRLGEGHKLKPLFDSPPPVRRQDSAAAYALNGALYLAGIAWLQATRSFLSPETVAHVMPPERSVDIDTPLDWRWAEFLMGGGHG